MKELLASLRHDPLFQSWQQQHPTAYCSHFFGPISAEFVLKTPWEIGFYDDATGKITVFAEIPQGFEIKPADDVFRKDQAAVEKLAAETVKIPADQAIALCKELMPQKFPGEKLGNGFLILQTINKVTIWNFSFITHTLKFVNVKINAATGIEESHETINLVQGKNLGAKPTA